MKSLPFFTMLRMILLSSAFLMTGIMGVRSQTCTLTGLVTDQCTGLPVAGAVVRISAIYTTLTGPDGIYTATNLPVGVQTVMVSKTGYISWSGTVSLISNTVVTCNVALNSPPSPVTGVMVNDTTLIAHWNPPTLPSDNKNSSPPCLIGYVAGLYNILGAFTTDTTIPIDPAVAIYGQTCQFCVQAIYPNGSSDTVCHTFISRYLFPPDSLTVTPQTCSARITWHKPGNPVALQALTGYLISRDGTVIHYHPHPDSLTYLAPVTEPGYYRFSVAATYDLGVYGFAGQTGASWPLEDSIPVFIPCGIPVPFSENWETGGFAANHWTFAPDTGNWAITTGGDAAGSFVTFGWSPPRFSYRYALISDDIDGFSWNCANLRLDFDYRLEDFQLSGTEYLKTEIQYDSVWIGIDSVFNHGNAGWSTRQLELTGASGHVFRIRFAAGGVNSGNIRHWDIDNIRISGVCNAPVGLTATVSGMTVSLNWNPPECPVPSVPAGYNIYRSDPAGHPPYVLRNTLPVANTGWTDSTGPGNLFYYYVTALFPDPFSASTLCESASTDTAMVNTVGVNEGDRGSIRVYPNPAQDRVYIRSGLPVKSLDICNIRGQILLRHVPQDPYNFSVDLAGFQNGPCILRLMTSGEATGFLVMIQHQK